MQQPTINGSDKKQLMLGKRVTEQQLAMVCKRGRLPDSKSIDNRMTVGADKFGWRTMQQARGKNATINHRQQHQRRSDIGRCCSNSESRGMGAAATFVNSSCCQRGWWWEADGANGSIIDGKGTK